MTISFSLNTSRSTQIKAVTAGRRGPVTAPAAPVQVPFIGPVAEGQPVIFLVNGYGAEAIPPRVKAEVPLIKLDNGTYPIVHESNWNDIRKPGGGTVDPDGSAGVMRLDGGVITAPTPFTNDSFVSQMQQVIDALPATCPLVMIGHSLGGDSVLKVAERIGQRKVDFLGLLDPVGAGGYRAPVIVRRIPSNVRYFFNRYQQTNPFPLENLVNLLPMVLHPWLVFAPTGHFLSSAEINNQHIQNFRRRSNGNYRFNEIQTPLGPIPTPIPQLLLHAHVPTDNYIQAQIIRILRHYVLNPNPWIVAAQPMTYYQDFQLFLSGVRVRFNEAVQPSTFTPADVMLTRRLSDGSWTHIPVTEVKVVQGSADRAFGISFNPPVRAPSVLQPNLQLQFRIGPDILDADDNQMDQDRDGVAGDERGDRFLFMIGRRNVEAVDFLDDTLRQIQERLERYLEGFIDTRDYLTLPNVLADFRGMVLSEGLAISDRVAISIELVPERPGWAVVTFALRGAAAATTTRRFAVTLSPEAATIQQLYHEVLGREPEHHELASSLRAIKSRPGYEAVEAALHEQAASRTAVRFPEPQAEGAAVTGDVIDETT